MPINFCSEIQTNLQNVVRFLLKRKDVPKLSDQQRVVKDALVPFPLYNCVHVKTDVPAKEFGGKCSAIFSRPRSICNAPLQKLSLSRDNASSRPTNWLDYPGRTDVRYDWSVVTKSNHRPITVSSCIHL